MFLAQGILRKPADCAKGRNLCPGCIIEGTRQRKTATVESEILEANTPNNILAPLLEYTKTPVSIKQLRLALRHLPTMNTSKRDDSIYGVVRYIANSFGFRLSNATAGTIDEPISSKQSREQWRQATFSCKCSVQNNMQEVHGGRAFCTTCSFIITHRDPANLRLCPGCISQDSWGPIGFLCLACQFATVIFRNRFMTRYNGYMEKWLPMLASDAEEDETLAPAEQTPRSSQNEHISQRELLRLRQLTLNESFTEIRSRSSPDENRCIIENITMLQRDIKRHVNHKRDIQSFKTASDGTPCLDIDENLSPRKKNPLQQKLFSDMTSCSSVSCSQESSCIRPPLVPLDMNSECTRPR